MIPQRIARLARYERRFTRFASPRYWRERGMKLLYLPYASDPALFHPVPHAQKDLALGLLRGLSTSAT